VDSRDGEIDFSKFSNDDLNSSFLRIDKATFPKNYQAALTEIEKRKSNGTINEDSSRLSNLDEKIRLSLLIGSILFSAAIFILNRHFQNIYGKNFSVITVIFFFYLFLLGIWRFWQGFKCPVCHNRLGKSGVAKFIKEKTCPNCGIKASN
jgi:hypothetical protein